MRSGLAERADARAVVDGRLARSTRTFFAVLDALLALVQEGNVRPTAAQVAERAGVSRRSVYLHFDTTEALLAAAADRHAARTSHLWAGPPPALPLDRRIDELVARWSAALEETACVRRAIEAHRPLSPALTAHLRARRDATAAELARVFAPELAGRPAEARAELLDVLEVTTSWRTWEQLRVAQELSVGAAAVVTRVLRSLLAAGGP